jgi:hypothetical protein
MWWGGVGAALPDTPREMPMVEMEICGSQAYVAVVGDDTNH